MICLNCLHRLPYCLLSLLIMCAAVSEEAAASDILVGALRRIMCWTRARSSSSELVDTATAHGSSEWKTPRVWDCSSHFAQKGAAEDHPASPRSGVTRWRRPSLNGPLPPDVTLDAPYWWQPECHCCGLHGASAAEAQTRHVC